MAIDTEKGGWTGRTVCMYHTGTRQDHLDSNKAAEPAFWIFH